MYEFIRNNKLISTLILFISMLLITVCYQNIRINNINSENEELKTNEIISIQNRDALNDSLKQIKSDKQNYKVFVDKLLSENIKDAEIKGALNNKVILLQSEIRTLKEKTIINGSNYVIHNIPFVTDSNIIRVMFGGSFKKVNVSGYTEYNILTSKNNFTLNIEKEPFNIKTYLYFNPKDSSVSNIVHIDGDSVLSTAVLSTDLYKLLINGLPAQKGFFDRLSAGCYISYNDRIDIGAVLKYDYKDFSLSSTRSYYNWDVRLNYTKSINEWFRFFRR